MNLAFETLNKAQDYVRRGRYWQELDLNDVECEVVTALSKMVLEGNNEDNCLIVFDALAKSDLHCVDRPLEYIAQET